MKDIVLFVIGIISIILILWFERDIFKDKEDNFKSIISKKDICLSNYLLNLGFIMPVFTMDEKESFTFIIKNNNQDSLWFSIQEDGYIYLKNKYDTHRLYKTINKDFKLDFFKKFISIPTK